MFEYTYSKLPKSLRDKLYKAFVGIEISHRKLLKVIKKTSFKKEKMLLSWISRKITTLSIPSEALSTIQKICTAFDADLILNSEGTSKTDKDSDVKRKINAYYGIT